MESTNTSTSLEIYLPQNIRSLRKRMKYSQEELAQQIGLNRGNIASYENGSAEPKICNLLKLSNLFRVSLLDLTKKDLREEDNYQTASSGFLAISAAELKIITQFLEQAEELKKVVDSLHHCHCFKKKSVSNENSCAQTMSTYFDQLYEITSTLFQSHQELLEFVKTRMK